MGVNMDIRTKRGTLVRWNNEQRVGFIAPDDGSDELRILGANLLPYEHTPQEGQAVVYRQWKDRLRGIKVIKGEIDLGHPIKLTSPFDNPNHTIGIDTMSWQFKVGLVVCALVLASLLYLLMINYELGTDGAQPPAGLFPAGSEHYIGKQILPNTHFSCDTRKQCLQMTSCQEAQYFVQHCSGFEKMVGEMPCEKLWCKM